MVPKKKRGDFVMIKLLSKTIENLKLHEENLLFERLTKNSLFQVLGQLASSINVAANMDKAEFEKSLGKIKYDDKLQYDAYYLTNDTIYLSESLKLKDLKTKIYVLSCALSSFVIGSKETTPLDHGMKETLADMIASNAFKPMQESFSSKNYITRDYVEMLLSLDNPYKLMGEYIFGEDKAAFVKQLESIVRKNNLNLNNFNGFIGQKCDTYINSNDYDHIFADFELDTLIYYCFNKNSKTPFMFNNIFLKDHIIRRYLRANYFNISSLESLALNLPSSLNLADTTLMLTHYLEKYPNDFYRIRPFIDESLLNKNIKAFIDRNDASFDAIVKDIKSGKFNCDLKQYTYCYNPHASNSDRLIFLEELVKSKGIVNGFLLNELLEIVEQKRKSNLNDYNNAYNLIEEATFQFWNFKANNESAPYDAYTSRTLSHSLYLMNDYYFDEDRAFRKKHGSKSMKMIYSLSNYEKLSRYEFDYLMLTYGKKDFLKNPESLTNDELIDIVNNKNIRINRKYFQEILKSRGILKQQFSL